MAMEVAEFTRLHRSLIQRRAKRVRRYTEFPNDLLSSLSGRGFYVPLPSRFVAIYQKTESGIDGRSIRRSF